MMVTSELLRLWFQMTSPDGAGIWTLWLNFFAEGGDVSAIFV